MALETQTFPGTPDGMNLAHAAHVIPDTFARYIQDGLLDEQGLIDRRGPLRSAPGFALPVNTAHTEHRAFGLIGAYRPDNVFKIASIHGTDSATIIRWLSDDFSTAGATYSLPHAFPNSAAYPIVDTKPAMGAGVLLGMADKYGLDATKRSLAYWRGAGKADYATGTITATIGSTAVTGSGTAWLANAEPGMFLLRDRGSGTFSVTGVVKTVNSDTSITLEQNSIDEASGSAYKLSSVRGLGPRVANGRITVAASATTVNGGDTKFKDQGLDGNWVIYRARDLALVGIVSSVASNIQLTLSSGASNAMSNERYIAIKTAGETLATSNPLYGFLSAAWNGRQFYGNTNSIANNVNQTRRIRFGEQIDIEAVDLSPDNGSFFDIPSSFASTPGLMALAPTQNALLAIDEFETYGVFGSDPDNWSARKIADDGALSTMSVVPHEGNVVWAGKKGIYYYDGVNVNNLVEDRLGRYYEKMVAVMGGALVNPTLVSTKSPGTVASDSSNGGTVAWVNPTNAVSSNDQYATADFFSPNVLTQYLKATNYGFNIPTGSTITGIEVKVERKALFGTGLEIPINDDRVSIVKSTGAIGTTNKASSSHWPQIEAVATYGGPTDLWGEAWSVSDINDPDFGVALSANVQTPAVNTASVDHVQIVVHYQAPAAAPGAWALVDKNHYLLFLENITSPGGITKGSITTIPSRATIAVNLRSGAVTFLTNIDIRGAVQTPSSVGKGTLFLNERLNGSNRELVISDATNLFADEGSDSYAVRGGTIGPDFYFESKKYDLGDPQWKKFFKSLLLWFWVTGDNLKLDIVKGLGEEATTSTTEYPPVTQLTDKRVKFQKRSQFLAFRLYQKSANVTKVRLGPWALGFKWMRRGKP